MSEHSDPANVTPPSVDRLSALWRRVNEHKLVQWSVAYIALAYGIQHGVTLTAEAFEWPHAVERVSMLLLILGLPVVMTLAWYHGARATRHVSKAEMSIISLLLVIGAFLFYTFAQPLEHIAASSAPATQQASLSLPSTTGAQANGISLAVLPFANLSADKDQEFFSDGMTDEIASSLAKVPDLRVVGRSSAFQFKGQNRDLKTVGETLHASHIIEGSVRKAGNRVRITAQLTEADNGLQMWTESYDRELTDVFAIQEDIARAIASSLRVPLGLQQGQSLVTAQTNIESYDKYLHAKALERAGGSIPVDVIPDLKALVADEPGYASAWALLARAYFMNQATELASRTGSEEDIRRATQEREQQSESAAQKALSLDPRQPIAYEVLASIQTEHRQWVQADDLFQKALSFDGNEPEVLYALSAVTFAAGRIKETMRLRERAKDLEPLSSIYKTGYANILRANGDNEASLKILADLPSDRQRDLSLAEGFAMAGRYGEAAKTLRAYKGNVLNPRSMEAAAQVLENAPAKAPMPQSLPILEGQLSFVYAFVGATDRMMEWPERALEKALPVDNTDKGFWRPYLASLRKTERFKAYMRKAGLYDYWKARGWADLCHPVGADDFACE